MSAEDYEVRWIGGQAAVAMPAEIDLADADEIHRALVSGGQPRRAGVDRRYERDDVLRFGWGASHHRRSQAGRRH
jgi:hypothetical protein